MNRTSAAIPLYRTDYSNTSQIVRLFSRQHGLVEGMARGAHRPRNPFQGPFDLAVLYDIAWIDRRKTNLALLKEAVVLEGFRGLRREWSRHVLASEVLEFLGAVVVPEDPTPALFDLSVATFHALAAEPVETLGWHLLRFELLALQLLGFLPSVDACAQCGTRWPGGRRSAYFSASAGGLLCRACREKQQDRYRSIDALPARAVAALRDLARRRLPAEEPAAAGQREVRKVQRDLHRCVTRSCTILLERPFRMVQYSAPLLGRQRKC